MNGLLNGPLNGPHEFGLSAGTLAQVMSSGGTLAQFALVIGALLLGAFAIVFIAVPIFKGIGSGITWTFRGIGWFIHHIVSFVVGVLGDVVRTIGAVIAAIVLTPLTLVSVVLGRWSRATHYASGVMREVQVAGHSLYRAVIRRPMRLLLLDGMLEGIEQRVPEAIAAAPSPDLPASRLGQFTGYKIVGTLKPGGSGARLYVAEPEGPALERNRAMPELVVIKSFAIEDGSSLPQIIRESRALESAKQMGLILDHGLDESRFFYVMPYHAGESLGVVVRQLHGSEGREGLGGRSLAAAVGFVADLVATLDEYHRGGLWHKDVKPENIIIHNGRAHLVDLGLVTPLRSAMTLTTHGTEYFRDPEMVRQALRGVKVHQVDGAKFDVYGAGAVLYFALENTFPAHGGLSAFARRSPESLRWIVRRAMAEYSKRYEKASEMLTDLQFVLGASDPWAVRPADLPSMSGRAVSTGAMGGVGAGVAASIAQQPGRWRNEVVQPKAPSIRVSSWWTGEYQVVDAAEIPTFPPPAKRAGQHSEAASGRPTAAAQIAAAKARAASLRDRAVARARRGPRTLRRPNRPTGELVVLVLIAIAFVGSATAVGLRLLSTHSAGVSSSRSVAAASIPPGASAQAMAVSPGASRAQGPDGRSTLRSLQAIVVSTHPDPSNAEVLRHFNQAVARYGAEGWALVLNDVDAAAEIVPLLPLWSAEPNRYDDTLEDALEAHRYAAVVWIHAAEGRGPSARRTKVTLIRSTRDGAELRFAPESPPPVRVDAEGSGVTEGPGSIEAPVRPVAPAQPSAPTISDERVQDAGEGQAAALQRRSAGAIECIVSTGSRAVRSSRRVSRDAHRLRKRRAASASC